MDLKQEDDVMDFVIVGVFMLIWLALGVKIIKSALKPQAVDNPNRITQYRQLRGSISVRSKDLFRLSIYDFSGKRSEASVMVFTLRATVRRCKLAPIP